MTAAQEEEGASILGEVEAELASLEREGEELALLVRQNQAEVRLLTQRRDQALARLRQAEMNLDNYTRPELKEIYIASSESELRLALMQSELEHLQSKQRLLEGYLRLLRKWSRIARTLETALPQPLSPERASALEPTGKEQVAKIIEAQEEERHRLARQIHDGPAQSLTNVALRAELCERLLEDPLQARAELRELKRLVTLALDRTRGFIFDLRPMILDDLGLVPTLRRYLQTLHGKTGLAVELSTLGAERRWPTYFEVAIFRIIQEALENAWEQGKASKAQVMLDMQNEAIQLSLEDDGRAYTHAYSLASAREHKAESMVLARILERVESLGGELEMDSSPASGSKISIRIPIPSGR